MEDYKLDEMEDIKSEEYLNVLVRLSEEIFHDFKNTLATISGLAQLTSLETMSEEAKNNLSIINQSTLESGKVLDRFYNLTEGITRDKKDYLSLVSIVLKTLDLIKHRINNPRRDREIKLNLNLDSSKKIYGNEYKIKQAILNIILNALDAMEVTGGILEINLFEEGNRVVLEILDTGEGISGKDLKYIFNSNFTTKGEKGTGLGLRISKDVIEEYEGEIYVESRLSYGSKFIIKLPGIKE